MADLENGTSAFSFAVLFFRPKVSRNLQRGSGDHRGMGRRFFGTGDVYASIQERPGDRPGIRSHVYNVPAEYFPVHACVLYRTPGTALVPFQAANRKMGRIRYFLV